MTGRLCCVCHEIQTTHAVFWFDRTDIMSICAQCHADHWRFTESGHLEQRRPRRQAVSPVPLSDLDAAIARANEDYHARLREASKRRWARVKQTSTAPATQEER